MARSPGDGLVVVRTPFFAGKKLVAVGEVWGADDDVVRNYPGAFRPVEVKSSAVEAPAVRRPATRTRTARRRSTSKK